MQNIETVKLPAGHELICIGGKGAHSIWRAVHTAGCGLRSSDDNRGYRIGQQKCKVQANEHTCPAPAAGELVIVESVKPLTDTTAETLAALAAIDAEATRRESAPAEPQYVTVTDEQGVIWHLTDADGQPVAAGEYTAKDGDRFTIAEHPEAYFGLSVNEAPRTVDITWQTICGKPRSKRQSGVFGAYVDMIVDGWAWTPEFA